MVNSMFKAMATWEWTEIVATFLLRMNYTRTRTRTGPIAIHFPIYERSGRLICYQRINRGRVSCLERSKVQQSQRLFIKLGCFPPKEKGKRQKEGEEQRALLVLFFDLKMDPANNQTHKTPQFTKLSSHSVKSVTLYDWWLVRPEGKGLAVGGIASRESQEVRAFCSAAIAKRYDTTTLETADGITITLSNLINRSRTNQNGFPLQVCNLFLHGFPFYWEQYADQCCGQEYINRGSLFEAAGISQSVVSLDDVPATRLRDLLISPRGHSDDGVLQREILDVLRKCGCSSVQDKTPSNHQSKATSGRKHRAAVKRLPSRGVKRLPSRGVVTRSMAKLQNFASLQNTDSAEFSTEIDGIVAGNGSQRCHATTFSDNGKELPKSPGNSAVRRSSRLKNQAK